MVNGRSWHSHDRRFCHLENPALSINQHVVISLRGHSVAAGPKSIYSDPPRRLSLVAVYSDGIYSIQNTSVAIAMLLFATTPFMAAVLCWIILRERVRVAITVAIGGIAIMVADESGGGVLRGSLAALGSAFGCAVFTVA